MPIVTFRAEDRKIRETFAQDEGITKLIEQIGEVSITHEPNRFKSLVMAIAGQQLSSKVAAVIRGRVSDLAPDFTPEAVYALDPEHLRAAGLSRPKIAYIRDLCEHAMDGRLDLAGLGELEDADVIEALVRVKGIGRWTAEMFLIFSLGRPDVLATGDLGLQRAARWLYRMEERVDKNYLGVHAEKWRPMRSVASLFLWEAIDRGLVDSGLSI